MMDGTLQGGATTAQLEAIRRAGQWMPWAGLGLAVVWWASVAVTVVTSIDRAQFQEAGPLAILAAVSLAAVPGLVVLFAGYVAREGARRNAASSLILKAATQLLNPSKAYGDEAETLAASLKASSEEIDQAMATALTAMRSVSNEMGDERLRLESVTYAAADNARDLAARLGDERAALETLTRDLREQADAMGETIPRQAAQMVDAARAASFDMAKSDEALEQRLHALKQTGQKITEEFSKIDNMAHTLQKQGDTLVFAVSRLETQLQEAQQTVENTIKAGDVATGAATETGEAMTESVKQALDHARQLNAEINASARQASDEARRAMAELRYAAEQTASAITAASASNVDGSGVADPELRKVVESLNDAAARSATPVTPTHGASSTLNGSGHDQPTPSAKDAAQRPAPVQPQRAPDIPRAIPDPLAPEHDARKRGLNGHRDLNGQGSQRASEEEEPPLTERGTDTPAPSPKPILPPPAETEKKPVVTLTSTRSAGFAQPSAHVPMPNRLEGTLADRAKESSKSPARPGASSEKPLPRAVLGGAPVPVTPKPARVPQSAKPRRSDRPSTPRLDASPRELEDELFGGDELGKPATGNEGAWPKPPLASEPIVEDNIFHANPRAADDLAKPAANGQAGNGAAVNGRGATHRPSQGDAKNAHPSQDALAPREAPRAVSPPPRSSGLSQSPPNSAPPVVPDRSAPAQGQIEPPPANVDVAPSLQSGGAPARPPSADRHAIARPSTAQSSDGTSVRKGDADWSTILSEMDREETGQLPREETAENVIQRLETSGIALSNIFRPKAKKKIAAAARKGEQSRRAAIVSAARAEVDRVAKRLVADPELAQLAEDFVVMEEPDAIAALDRTQKSGRNASSRLSAFLLLDAATSSQRTAH